MPWTNEYEQSRSQMLQTVNAITNQSNRNRRASKAGMLLHFHYRDENNQRMILTRSTDVYLSGRAENENTPANRLAHPQAAESPREAEHMVDREAREIMLEVSESGLRPYKITGDLLGDKPCCDRCAFTMQTLADDMAVQFPTAGDDVKLNAFALRSNQPPADHRAYVGRQGRSTYGSGSAEPVRIGTTQVWRDTYIPGETDHRTPDVRQDIGRGSDPSYTDRSPYTSSYENSSGRSTSPGSSSGGGGGDFPSGHGSGSESETSHWSNEANRSSNFLPGTNPSGRVSHANTPLDLSSLNLGPTFSKDYKTVVDNGETYKKAATVGDLHAYAHTQTGDLGLWDAKRADWTAYPGYNAKDWVREQAALARAGKSAGESSRSHGESSGSSRHHKAKEKKKHVSGK
ncbi:hypothetical protein [Krasilnikovia sp. MM14-A1004]|uniref:hypothetical protein n=1 Tax=Krasilnikovia sp. MM14-A1004 TaxID=3373541 RepID=UPI00399D3EF3